MKDLHVEITSWENSESYDPRMSWNGGGYAQPTVTGVISWDGCEEPIQFVINDTSCGEFGSRYEISFDGTAEMSGRYATNDLDFGGEIPDESSFGESEDLLAVRDEFYRVTGFYFLTKEEIEREMAPAI